VTMPAMARVAVLLSLHKRMHMITITTMIMVTTVTATAIRYGQRQQGFRVSF
jgi:hypothetical protein